MLALSTRCGSALVGSFGGAVGERNKPPCVGGDISMLPSRMWAGPVSWWPVLTPFGSSMTPPEPTAALLHAERRHGTTYAGLFSFPPTTYHLPTYPSVFGVRVSAALSGSCLNLTRLVRSFRAWPLGLPPWGPRLQELRKGGLSPRRRRYGLGDSGRGTKRRSCPWCRRTVLRVQRPRR